MRKSLEAVPLFFGLPDVPPTQQVPPGYRLPFLRDPRIQATDNPVEVLHGLGVYGQETT